MKKQDWTFQDDAVKSVLDKFEKNPYSKNLLVIPTGGGKTIAALKIVSKLIENGFLNKEKKAIWATHLKNLKKQTKEASISEKNIQKYNFVKNIQNYMDIEMVTNVKNILRKDRNSKYKLLIIDEAHHSAANTYKEFFNRKMGILGLTATPSRTDEVQLDFDETTFEITFKELIEKNIIIKPKFKSYKTYEKINVNELDSTSENNKFNIKTRNERIANIILDGKKKYKKIIVFVGTTKHVKDLYEIIKNENKFRGKPYEHVGYIISGDNERGVDNDAYLKWHKKISSSILINCGVLTEGYNDPTINTAVMAVPTKSALYYIQCIGRVVRNPLESGEHDIYVVELTDDLPNINYRIDNKWLFADISEYLEPIIIEKEYYNKKSLKETILSIIKEHRLEERYIDKLNNIKENEYMRILLFSANRVIDENSKWWSIIINEDNKKSLINIFNVLSNDIDKYYKKSFLYVFERLGIKKDDEYFKDRALVSDFLSSLNKAYEEIKRKEKIKRLKYIVLTKVKEVVSINNKEDKYEKLKLDKIKININDLLLDPNNPRFCKHFDEMVTDEKISDKDIQEDTFRKMLSPSFHFDITELAGSIRSKGFVNVDNVFVRKIGNKHLVIEGNRRITAIKLLLREHNSGKRNSQISDDLLRDLQKIECIDLSNEKQSEIDFILGLRHHGSIKEWDLLPKSFNIFNRYMEEFCKEEMHGINVPEAFAYDRAIAGRISIIYNLKLKDVRDKLRAYRAYIQLKEMSSDPELQKKFIIIRDALQDSVFRNRFGFDEVSCIFSDEGAEKFLKLIIGNEDFKPVLWASASGESGLRDYLYVLKNGTPGDIERIEEEGEEASAVKADLKSKQNIRDLHHCLERALIELKKIKLAEDFEGLGENEKEILDEIEKNIDKIRTLSKKKK